MKRVSAHASAIGFTAGCRSHAVRRRLLRVLRPGLCALVAGAVWVPPGIVPSAAAQSLDRRVSDQLNAGPYSFSKQFDIAETSNQQGLAYGGGFLWVCFDTGSGTGKIIKYSMSGMVKKRSPRLPLGHCAEIDYRERDGTLYAVDYLKGSSVANVRVVDMSLAQPAVVRTFDVAIYGLGQMVAIDNARDQLLVKGGSRPYRFNFFTLAGTKSGTTVRWLREVTHLPSLGIPQGLEVVGNDMLFLTTNHADGAISNNRIHVFGLNGEYKTYIDVPITRESEGLAIDPTNNNLYLGFNRPNSVYSMSPPYQAIP